MKPLLLVALAALAVGAPMSTAGAAAPPNDTYYDLQWGPRQIHAEQAWATSTGKGQVIAVVDSGVDLAHPDLSRKPVGGATFTGCPDAPNGCGDGDWESGPATEAASPNGTHVAGIAAAVTDNGTGIASVAPAAKLMPVKVLTDEGGTFEEVNLSFGALPGIQALPLVGELDDAKRDQLRREQGRRRRRGGRERLPLHLRRACVQPQRALRRGHRPARGPGGLLQLRRRPGSERRRRAGRRSGSRVRGRRGLHGPGRC